MAAPRSVLIVEDDQSLRRVMEFHLSGRGWSARVAGSAEEALRALRESLPDVLVTDMSLPGMSGLELLREVKRIASELPVIVITAYGTIQSAVEAMRDGAFHYLTKPVSNEELELLLDKAVHYERLTRENRRLQSELRERYRFENIVGNSGAMKHLYEIMGRVAASDATVLIQGESGTGKELIARAIHYNSARSAGPFVPINCGAIPKELVESELFGVVRGAFTGAVRDRTGRFEQADGGTLFLDEVAELSPDIQVKLLRVLQERVVTPLGGERSIAVNVRVIAATNRSLETAVAEGEFREDIFYRLNVVGLRVPPLRERTEDIPLLARHFLAKFGQPQTVIEPDAFTALAQYPWPGNVRQLENAIERATVLQRTPNRLALEDLPPEITAPPARPQLPVDFPDEGINLEENEKRLIQMALAKTQGNQTRAAQLLGVSRHVLIYRMQKHGLREQ